MKRKSKRILLIGALLLAVCFFLGQQFLWGRDARLKQWKKAAQSAFDAGRYAEAGHLYDNALKIDPDNTDLLKARVEAGLRADFPQSVKSSLDKLAKNGADSPEYRQFLYRYALQSGDFPLAESLLQSLEGYVPSADEYRKIIKGLFDGAFYTQAEKLCETALKVYPKDRRFDELSLASLTKLDEPARAIALYEAVPKLDPDVETLNYLARSYKNAGQPEAACRLWTRSFLKKTDQPHVPEALLRTLAEIGDTRSYLRITAEMRRHQYKIPEIGLNIFGNTAPNVRGKGFAASQGKAVYIADPLGRGLFGAEDGVHFTRLSDLSSARGLNVRGDSLYYADAAEHMALKRFSLTDHKTETVFAGRADSPLLWGNELYFINLGDENRLYAFDLKERKLVRKTDIPVRDYALDGDFIYFIGEEDRDLYRQKQSETRIERHILGKFSELTLDEASRIYLIDQEAGGISRCEKDGSNRVLLMKTEAESLNYNDGRLYFARWTPYSMKTDGSDAKSLASNITSELVLLDDWVYAYADKAEKQSAGVYRFRQDGRDWALLTY